MWIIYSLIQSALYASTNIIEKYVIDKKVKSPLILTIFGGLIVFLIGIIIFFVLKIPLISFKYFIVLIISGFFLELYLLPYFQALVYEDASIVVPLFQFVPIFSLILSAIFLKEILTIKQLVGFFIILFGGLIITSEEQDNKVNWLRPRKVMWLMMLSSFFASASSIFFKFVVIKTNFWTTLAYQYIGVGLMSLILFTFFINKNSLKKDFKFSIIPIFSIDKLIEISGHILGVYAITLAPVALFGVIANISQPIFVFILGIILTLFLPSIIKEDLRKKTVILKLISMIIIFVGAIFII